MKYHANLEFLRSGGVKYAMDKLRDAGIVPRKMLARTLPKHVRAKGWDNYGKVEKYFLAHYCFAQGLSRSSDVTKQVYTIVPCTDVNVTRTDYHPNPYGRAQHSYGSHMKSVQRSFTSVKT